MQEWRLLQKIYMYLDSNFWSGTFTPAYHATSQILTFSLPFFRGKEFASIATSFVGSSSISSRNCCALLTKLTSPGDKRPAADAILNSVGILFCFKICRVKKIYRYQITLASMEGFRLINENKNKEKVWRKKSSAFYCITVL